MDKWKERTVNIKITYKVILDVLLKHQSKCVSVPYQARHLIYFCFQDISPLTQEPHFSK